MTINQNELKAFADAIAVPLFNSDGIKWPVRSGPLILNVGDLLAVEYREQLKLLFSYKSKEKLKESFPNSVCVWRTTHHTINGLKKAHLSDLEIAETSYWLMKLVQVISGNDTLYSKWHLIKHKYDLENLYNNNCSKSPDSIRKVLYLSSLLWAYAESLYFQAREICCEYHGLYELNNSRVLIREYKNLVPKDLWGKNNFLDNDYSSITIITYHRNDFDITIDAYNNVGVSSGNFYESCEGFTLIIDDIFYDENKIEYLLKYFSEKIEKQVDYVMKLERVELYKKYLDIFWYRKKDLAKIVGHNWQTPDKAYEIIEKVKIEDNKENPYRKRMRMEEISSWFDYSEYSNEIVCTFV